MRTTSGAAISTTWQARGRLLPVVGPPALARRAPLLVVKESNVVEKGMPSSSVLLLVV